MTPETLAIIGGVLSLIMERTPYLSVRFHQLNKGDKQIVILLLGVVVALVLNALSCANLGNFECKNWGIIADILTIWGSQQVAHVATKEILK